MEVDSAGIHGPPTRCAKRLDSVISVEFRILPDPCKSSKAEVAGRGEEREPV